MERENEGNSAEKIEITAAMVSAAEAYLFEVLSAAERGAFLSEASVAFTLKVALEAGGFSVREFSSFL